MAAPSPFPSTRWKRAVPNDHVSRNSNSERHRGISPFLRLRPKVCFLLLAVVATIGRRPFPLRSVLGAKSSAQQNSSEATPQTSDCGVEKPAGKYVQAGSYMELVSPSWVVDSVRKGLALVHSSQGGSEASRQCTEDTLRRDMMESIKCTGLEAEARDTPLESIWCSTMLKLVRLVIEEQTEKMDRKGSSHGANTKSQSKQSLKRNPHETAVAYVKELGLKSNRQREALNVMTEAEEMLLSIASRKNN